MKAVVFDGKGSVEYREVKTPAVGEFDLLLKVGAASICGTDIRILKKGHHLIPEGTERILGHEFSGEVWDVGSCVEGFEKGMRVAVAPNIGCGKCTYCRRGDTHMCTDLVPLGMVLDGGFAEYVKIPGSAVEQGNVVVLDDDTSFEEAALAEPLCCCYNALRSVFTRPGDAVLVVGTGPMGMLHIQLQKLAGASPLMVADIADNRLAMTKPYGPDVLINPEREDLTRTIMDHTGGRGADVIITAVPSPQVQQQAIHMAAKFARVNLFGGLPKGNSQVPLDTNVIHYNQIMVTGVSGGSPSDYETAVRLIVQGKVDVASLVSKKFSVEKPSEAFSFAMSGEGLKTLFTF